MLWRMRIRSGLSSVTGLLCIMLLAVLLGACSNSGGGGNCKPQQPQNVVAWTNFGLCGQTQQLGTQFQIGSNVIGYVITPQYSPLTEGQTMTLGYSVQGQGGFRQNDPNDSNPATITLFIWEHGDNLQDPQHRWWCPTRGDLTPGDHVLSCKIDPALWTNVYGQTGVGDQGWSQALANPLAVGFTFGGKNFYGHGVTSSPPVTFFINSWSVP